MKNTMLELALRRIKAGPKEEETTPEGPDPLEQAMDDFQNATSKTERAEAFKAALQLAKTTE